MLSHKWFVHPKLQSVLLPLTHCHVHWGGAPCVREVTFVECTASFTVAMFLAKGLIQHSPDNDAFTQVICPSKAAIRPAPSYTHLCFWPASNMFTLIAQLYALTHKKQVEVSDSICPSKAAIRPAPSYHIPLLLASKQHVYIDCATLCIDTHKKQVEASDSIFVMKTFFCKLVQQKTNTIICISCLLCVIRLHIFCAWNGQDIPSRDFLKIAIAVFLAPTFWMQRLQHLELGINPQTNPMGRSSHTEYA